MTKEQIIGAIMAEIIVDGEGATDGEVLSAISSILVTESGKTYNQLEAEAEESRAEAEESRVMCPHCETEVMKHHVKGNTHLWICGACPNILFEFSTDGNIEDLKAYLNL